MERFLRLSLGLLLLATGLGLLLRLALVVPVPFLVFSHALHAHSHTLYFGWAALALFTLFFERVGASDAAVRRALWLVVAVSLATFVAFLHSGYGRPGVLVSASSLGVWGVVVTLFLRRARGRRELDVAWLRVAAWYVVVAVGAALARVALLVTKQDALWGQLAVAAFLTTFAGFFLFGLVGLFARFLAERGAPLDERLLRWQLWWMTPLTALTFPLGVPGAMQTPLGPLSRVAAVALVVPAALWVANLWSASRHLASTVRLVVRSVAVAWALKAILETGAAFGLTALAASSRHAVILLLHLVLLGVVSAALLLLLGQRLGRPSPGALLVHQFGVAVMTAGLLLVVGATTAGWPGGRLGLWLAFAGGAVVVAADGVLTALLLRRAVHLGPSAARR
ncbi:MAG: hypothetical protein IT380_07095 [Myxococcales bacterium]|nr:hypothetical protein [Myxococcales bacterium]